MKQIMVSIEEDRVGSGSMDPPQDMNGPADTTPLRSAAESLHAVLERETALARNGALSALETALTEKRQVAAHFMQVAQERQRSDTPFSEAEHVAIRRMMAAAEENALILDAVLTTTTDLSDRLRTALTSGADPGTYGPKGRGPRHAMAARYDTRI